MVVFFFLILSGRSTHPKLAIKSPCMPASSSVSRIAHCLEVSKSSHPPFGKIQSSPFCERMHKNDKHHDDDDDDDVEDDVEDEVVVDEVDVVDDGEEVEEEEEERGGREVVSVTSEEISEDEQCECELRRV